MVIGELGRKVTYKSTDCGRHPMDDTVRISKCPAAWTTAASAKQPKRATLKIEIRAALFGLSVPARVIADSLLRKRNISNTSLNNRLPTNNKWPEKLVHQ